MRSQFLISLFSNVGGVVNKFPTKSRTFGKLKLKYDDVQPALVTKEDGKELKSNLFANLDYKLMRWSTLLSILTC